MAKIACCHNCVFSYWDREHTVECMGKGVMNWPACANYPESLGRMERAPERGMCVNYRPRAAQPEGDVRQIPLGDGYYAYVDATDYEWLRRWSWSLRSGYAARRESGRLVFMHRQIMQPPQGMVVDHKNRNKLDNTRANLHNCTSSENAQNHAKRRDATSRFVGVSYHKGTRRYQARLYHHHRSCFIGFFAGEIEAARAHDRKAVEVLGESARLNFPEEWPAERRAEVYAHPDTVKAGGQARRKAGRERAGTGERPRSPGKGRRSRDKRCI